MTVQVSEGTWIESITLFELIRDGDYAGAISLLDTSSDPATALYGLGRLFHCFFNAVDHDAINAFAETARTMPPPRVPSSLSYTPPINELASSHIALIVDENKVHHEPEIAVLDSHTLQLPPTSPLVLERSCGTNIDVIFVDPQNSNNAYRFPGLLTAEGTITLRKRY